MCAPGVCQEQLGGRVAEPVHKKGRVPGDVVTEVSE